MSENVLVAVLESLERELHRCMAGSDSHRMAELLHPDFVEFGRSGRTYTFEQIFTQLREEPVFPLIHSQDYSVRSLAEDVALLTYRSANLGHGSILERHSLRSSVWLRGRNGWRLVFHQGTITEPFARIAR
jgi:hypothetical protein